MKHISPFLLVATALVFCFLLNNNVKAQGDKLSTSLIDLAESYQKFMGPRLKVPEAAFETLKKYEKTELATLAELIKECGTIDNKLLKDKFLKPIDSLTMKYLYVTRNVNFETHKDSPRPYEKVVKVYLDSNVMYNELLRNYYDVIFIALANKNQPFNMRKYNFDLSDMGFRNNTEKNIFYLTCTRAIGTQIWGYMNIPKSPNYEKAYEYIERFPTFDGLPYYAHKNIDLEDFQFIYGDTLTSFRGLMYDKLYELVLNHIIVLRKYKNDESGFQTILINSVLKESRYYPYTKYREILESIFKEVK
jgi:hypothetical protein